MPVFSLRLPETLEADARAKAALLGISINALVCVAVDAYLRGVALQPIAEPLAPSPTIPPASTPITTPEPVRQPSRQERRKLERLRAKAASNAN